MEVAVTGSSGLVGTALVRQLVDEGHRVRRLVRRQAGTGEVTWDPQANQLNSTDLAGVDAVVHLAGENIAAGRWTTPLKRRIVESRVEGTELIASAIAEMDAPPRVLVSASAIGYYGDRGDQVMDESSTPGKGFLADLCQRWEAACQAAREVEIRVVNARIGVVLSPEGGALAKMLFPFKMGLGGVVGSGDQYWSWVAIDDVVGAIEYALMTDTLEGPVNVVSPRCVTNREFTRTLGRVLRRPTWIPMPALVARMALGEMADELLLGSNRIVPRKLEATGYSFHQRELESALQHLLGK